MTESKAKIRSNTHILIKTIKNLQSILIKDIDQTIENYLTFFSTEEFNDLDEPEKILKTEMIEKDFNFESLISTIN